MPESFDPRCFFSAEVDHEAAAQVVKALGSEGLLKTGCRVVKHPNCCVLCAANDDCGRIPLHVHCFPAGTVVSGPQAVGSVVRRYCGDLVEIKTRSGAVLSATPNHPILTPQGWVAAGLLNEGDDVVGQRGTERLVVGDPGDYQEPALIEDVACAVGELRSVLTARVPVSAKDFHGDGLDGDVAVVRSNCLLRDRVESTLVEEHEKAEFRFSNGAVQRPLTHLRSVAFGLKRLCLTATSVLRGGRPGSVLFGSPPAHHQPVCGRSTPVVGEGADDLGDRVTTVSELLGKGVDGLPSTVPLDQIVAVKRLPFDGHVFNLETRTGWYLANSIVVHNCRCVPEPSVEGPEDIGAAFA